MAWHRHIYAALRGRDELKKPRIYWFLGNPNIECNVIKILISNYHHYPGQFWLYNLRSISSKWVAVTCNTNSHGNIPRSHSSNEFTVNGRVWSIHAHGRHFDHYNDVIMGMMASEITSLTIVYSTIYFGADQRKHQSSASPAFVWGIHRRPVNSPHKCPVTWKMFPFDDVIKVMLGIWGH